MPLYTYRCTNCGTELDHQQGFDAPPLTQCPTCQQEKLQRVYKPIRIVFKGSGFYATDHRSPSGVGKNNGQTSKSPESESKSAESTDSGKSETKTTPTTTETVS